MLQKNITLMQISLRLTHCVFSIYLHTVRQHSLFRFHSKNSLIRIKNIKFMSIHCFHCLFILTLLFIMRVYYSLELCVITIQCSLLILLVFVLLRHSLFSHVTTLRHYLYSPFWLLSFLNYMLRMILFWKGLCTRCRNNIKKTKFIILSLLFVMPA